MGEDGDIKTHSKLKPVRVAWRNDLSTQLDVISQLNKREQIYCLLLVTAFTWLASSIRKARTTLNIMNKAQERLEKKKKQKLTENGRSWRKGSHRRHE